MLKLGFSFFILLTLCLLNAGLSFAQIAPEPITGKWHSEGVYCAPASKEKGAKAKRTKIIQTDLVPFEPDVFIEIYNQQSESGQKAFLRKSVGGRSCTASEVEGDTFLDVTFASNFSARDFNGESIYSMRAQAVTNWSVNKAAFGKCGDLFERSLLFIGASIKYPGYFFQEMKRTYTFQHRNGKLFMVFYEKEICKDTSTIMVLGRVSP